MGEKEGKEGKGKGREGEIKRIGECKIISIQLFKFSDSKSNDLKH